MQELKDKIIKYLLNKPAERFTTFVFTSTGVDMVTTSNDYNQIMGVFEAQKEAYGELFVPYIYDSKFAELLDFGELPQVEDDLPIEIVDFEEETPENDVVNRPSHYNREGAMQCFDEFVELYGVEAAKCACLFNIHKYRYRAAEKNGLEDLKKSDWYMRKFKELNSR